MSILWPYFAFMILVFTLLSVPRCIRRRRLVNSLEYIEDHFFVEIFRKEFDVPEDYILEKRRFIGKKLRLPYKKLSPDFKMYILEDCWFLNQGNDASVRLPGELSEDLYYSGDSPLYKKEIKIETIAEYIYYSAIYDGIVYINGLQRDFEQNR